MEGCVKSGYSLVTAEGKVLKMDANGSQLALDLIKKTDPVSNWTVVVNSTVSGDMLAVSTIQMH
jgi:hypothetical protein